LPICIARNKTKNKKKKKKKKRKQKNLDAHMGTRSYLARSISKHSLCRKYLFASLFSISRGNSE
jgi:CDP-diacylglycerol pyrophosphatase